MRARYACAAVVLAALLAGCSSFGPWTLPRDRFDYSSALSESWKYQTLLNVVKLRYMDLPIFIDVAQVVSGYQLSASLSAGGSAAIDPATVPTIGSFLTFGGQGTYTDRPTITYTPLTGDDYLRGLMTPLRPEAVFFAVFSGNPADSVFFTSVESINGLRNQHFGGLQRQQADAGFLRLMTLLRQLQKSGALRFKIKENKEKAASNILFFRKEALTREEIDDIRECKQLLNLDPDRQEYQLVFGAAPETNQEIALQTRSLIQIMLEVSAQIDLPKEHIEQGRATPGFLEKTDEKDDIRFMRIYATKERSEYAFITITYRNYYFWIDDRDLKTKQKFVYLMHLFSLAEKGKTQPLPLITIPAQ